MDNNEQFDRLVSAYRAACPDPEPSADFMPGLWRKIEARNQFSFRLRRWSQVVLASTAIACAAMVAVVVTQSVQEPQSYVEVLSNDVAADNVAMLETNFQETAFIDDSNEDRSLEVFAQ